MAFPRPVRRSVLAGWATLVVAVPAGGSTAAQTPPAPEAVPAAPTASPGGALAAALASADTLAYVEELDRLLYRDLVDALPEADRPERPLLDPDLLRRSLPTTSALLAFLPDGESTWAVAVTNEGLLARHLDTPHTPVMAARLRHWIEDPTEATFDVRAALLLHNNLFPPFGGPLAGKRHVVVVAGGVLRGIPFETLLMATGEDLPPRERPYLIHRFEFSYEATLGSRLGWSSRPGDLRRLRITDSSGEPAQAPIVSGTLVAVAGRPPGGAAVASLRWIREGAQGALLGGTEAGMDAFLRRYFRERVGGRRPVVRAVYRVRSALLREGAPVDTWAWPVLFGAE